MAAAATDSIKPIINPATMNIFSQEIDDILQRISSKYDIDLLINLEKNVNNVKVLNIYDNLFQKDYLKFYH